MSPIQKNMSELDTLLMELPRSQLFDAMDSNKLNKEELERALDDHYLMTLAFVPSLAQFLETLPKESRFENLRQVMRENLNDEIGKGETESHKKLYEDLLRENFGKVPRRDSVPTFILEYWEQFRKLVEQSEPLIVAGAIYALEHQMAGMGGQFVSIQKQLAALGLKDTGYFQLHIDLDGNPEHGHAALERKAAIDAIKNDKDFKDFENGSLKMAELRKKTFDKVYKDVKGE